MKLIYKFTMDDFIKDYVKSQKYYFSSAALAVGMMAISILTAILKGLETPLLGGIIALILTILASVLTYLISKHCWQIKLKKRLQNEWPKEWPESFNIEIELLTDAIRQTDLSCEMRIPYANIQGIKEEKGNLSIDFKYLDSIEIPIASIQNIEVKSAFISALKEKITRA